MDLKYHRLKRTTQLQPWQYEILRLWACAVPLGEIAEGVGQTITVVRALVRSPAGRRLIQAMHDGTLETVRQMQVSIQALAPKALDRLSKQLDSKNEMVAHRAAVWVMEAAGHTPLRRLEIQHHIDADDLEGLTVEQLRERALRVITGDRMVGPLAIETTSRQVGDENPV